MEVESLAVLKAAFESWRRKKRHVREAVPGDLLERARLASRRHGPSAVARATKVDRGRLKISVRNRGARRARSAPMPAFTRLEVAAPAPAVGVRPFVEIETVTGLKVRLFTQTHESLALISALCGVGGAR